MSDHARETRALLRLELLSMVLNIVSRSSGMARIRCMVVGKVLIVGILAQSRTLNIHQQTTTVVTVTWVQTFYFN